MSIIIAKVSDRPLLQQRARELLAQRMKPARVKSAILSQAPHLAWKAPETF